MFRKLEGADLLRHEALKKQREERKNKKKKEGKE